MNILYKSSSLNLYTRYLITPLITVLLVYILYLVLTGNASGQEIDLVELPLMAWAVVMVNFLSFYTRGIKVTEENILIRSLRKETILNYKDIEWISQSYVGRPSLYIKYQDRQTGKSKLLITAPQIYNTEQFSTLLFHPFRELDVTSYIRTRIQAFRPEYNKSMEPSQWIFFWIIVFSLMPFLLISAILI